MLAHFGHRLDGIAHQVEKDLLYLDLVGKDEVGVGVEGEPHADAVLLRADQGKRARLLDQLGDALDALLAFPAADEVAQPPDDLPGAQRLFGGALHRLGDSHRFVVDLIGNQSP